MNPVKVLQNRHMIMAITRATTPEALKQATDFAVKHKCRIPGFKELALHRKAQIVGQAPAKPKS